MRRKTGWNGLGDRAIFRGTGRSGRRVEIRGRQGEIGLPIGEAGVSIHRFYAEIPHHL
jgi:hypothetical protein